MEAAHEETIRDPHTDSPVPGDDRPDEHGRCVSSLILDAFSFSVYKSFSGDQGYTGIFDLFVELLNCDRILDGHIQEIQSLWSEA